MTPVILPIDEYDAIMSEWRSAEAAVESADKAAQRYHKEHGHTSDELIDELVEAMHQQFSIMERLQARVRQ